MERNLDSASVYISALVILILTVTGFFDNMKGTAQEIVHRSFYY